MLANRNIFLFTPKIFLHTHSFYCISYGISFEPTRSAFYLSPPSDLSIINSIIKSRFENSEDIRKKFDEREVDFLLNYYREKTNYGKSRKI